MDFKVAGEYEVPLVEGRNGWVIDMKQIDEFWDICGLGDRKGCYVFGIRTGGGIVPIYVGKTVVQSFKDECFTPGNRQKLHEELGGYGSLVLFFVFGTTRPKREAIDQLEAYLIATAVEHERSLVNVQRNRLPHWTICGVGRGRGPGQPTSDVKKFTKMMGIEGAKR